MDKIQDLRVGSLYSPMSFMFMFLFFGSRLSRELHENLLTAERNINDHATRERLKIRQELTEAGSMARSTLRRTLQQFRASASQSSRSKVATQLQTKVETTNDGDNGTHSSSVVARRPISGI